MKAVLTVALLAASKACLMDMLEVVETVAARAALLAEMKAALTAEMKASLMAVLLVALKVVSLVWMKAVPKVVMMVDHWAGEMAVRTVVHSAEKMAVV